MKLLFSGGVEITFEFYVFVLRFQFYHDEMSVSRSLLLRLRRFCLSKIMASYVSAQRECSEVNVVSPRVPSVFRSVSATIESMAAARTAELAVRRAIVVGESG